MGSVSTSIRGVRFTLYIPGGNEWVRFPRHSVSGSTLLGLTWDSWCRKGTASGCAWCLRGAMLLRGFRLFGVALHREPKGTKRHRNLKKSTSRARNVPVTSFPRKEKNSCSKQSNLFLQICLVFIWGWMKTFKWLEASRSSSMGTPQGSLNHV